MIMYMKLPATWRMHKLAAVDSTGIMRTVTWNLDSIGGCSMIINPLHFFPRKGAGGCCSVVWVVSELYDVK